MKKKGSITVYLLMICSLLLLFAGAIFYSLRIEGARVMVQTGARKGLYSLFARYDPDLLERYDLLFLDGSCRTGEFAPGTLLRQVEKYAGIPWGGQRDRRGCGGCQSLAAWQPRGGHYRLYFGYGSKRGGILPRSRGLGAGDAGSESPAKSQGAGKRDERAGEKSFRRRRGKRAGSL